MLILQIIKDITNFTQDELAKYIGVSRATINYWLKGENISLSSKKLISDKFSFPISYFDISLNDNIEVYKIIYSTILNTWRQSNNTNELKVLEIIKNIKSDDKTINNRYIDKEDIIDGLLMGYNPFTGEIYNEEHILNNIEVKLLLNDIFKDYIKNKNFNTEENNKLDKLKKWRLDKSKEENTTPSNILSIGSLKRLACLSIYKEEDLLSIKGLDIEKYNKYKEELINIINGGF